MGIITYMYDPNYTSVRMMNCQADHWAVLCVDHNAHHDDTTCLNVWLFISEATLSTLDTVTVTLVITAM